VSTNRNTTNATPVRKRARQASGRLAKRLKAAPVFWTWRMSKNPGITLKPVWSGRWEITRYFVSWSSRITTSVIAK
jgi:hypothetical protein